MQDPHSQAYAAQRTAVGALIPLEAHSNAYALAKLILETATRTNVQVRFVIHGRSWRVLDYLKTFAGSRLSFVSKIDWVVGAVSSGSSEHSSQQV